MQKLSLPAECFASRTCRHKVAKIPGVKNVACILVPGAHVCVAVAIDFAQTNECTNELRHRTQCPAKGHRNNVCMYYSYTPTKCTLTKTTKMLNK